MAIITSIEMTSAKSIAAYASVGDKLRPYLLMIDIKPVMVGVVFDPSKRRHAGKYFHGATAAEQVRKHYKRDGEELFGLIEELRRIAAERSAPSFLDTDYRAHAEHIECEDYNGGF